MIEKLTTNDIAQILTMDDPIDEVFPCDKGEWVQWLNQYIENPEIYIIGKSDNGRLISYAVAVSMVAPPLSNTVAIIFMSELEKEFIENIKLWGKEKGAKNIALQSKDMNALKTLNVDKISYMGVWKV
jgi:hypothetical protein